MKHFRWSSVLNFYSRFRLRNVPAGVSQYSTALTPTSQTQRKPPKGSFDALYRRISRIGDPKASIFQVLDQWIEEGGPEDKHALVNIMKELRHYRHYKHALEISIWMTDKRYFVLSHSDVAIRLDLIAKVHGIEEAENYFNNIPKQLKVLQVYTSLLNCYAQAKLVEKAEAIMQKMRDIGFSRTSLTYNVLLNLYHQTGKYDKFDTLIKEMEENSIGWDEFTYGIRLSAYAAASDVEGVDEIMRKWESHPKCHMSWTNYAVAANGYSKAGQEDKALAMLEKSEGLISSSKRKRLAFEYLLTQYAVLGKKDSVVRLWELYKKQFKAYNRGYISIITSLLKIGDIEGAEKIFEEWESENLTYDIRLPNYLIGVYTRKGLLDKAETLINRVIVKGGKPNTMSWYYLAKGYVDHHQTEKAVELMRKALLASWPGWKPDKYVLAACLEYLKEKADLEGAEEFIRLYGDKSFIPVNIQERLLNYIHNKDSNSGARGEMELDGPNEDKEIGGLSEEEGNNSS